MHKYSEKIKGNLTVNLQIQ